MRSCQSCGAESAKLRRCTQEVLCASCRRSGEFLILTAAELRRQAPWLPAEDWPPARGRIVNSKNPRFARQPVYLWGDVALRCVELQLPVP